MTRIYVSNGCAKLYKDIENALDEFQEYVQTHLFKSQHYRYEWTPLLTEKDVVSALDKNEPLKIRIGY